MAIILLVACSKPADFQYLSGEQGSFNDLKGQWTVINYWAQWCKPCIKEIPELNNLNARHGNIRVIGINFDHPSSVELTEQSGKLSIQFDNILIGKEGDPFRQHFNYAKPTALPTTVIITPELTVKVILMGPQDEEALSALIKNYAQ